MNGGNKNKVNKSSSMLSTINEAEWKSDLKRHIFSNQFS